MSGTLIKYISAHFHSLKNCKVKAFKEATVMQINTNKNTWLLTDGNSLSCKGASKALTTHELFSVFRLSFTESFLQNSLRTEDIKVEQLSSLQKGFDHSIRFCRSFPVWNRRTRLSVQRSAFLFLRKMFIGIRKTTAVRINDMIFNKYFQQRRQTSTSKTLFNQISCSFHIHKRYERVQCYHQSN